MAPPPVVVAVAAALMALAYAAVDVAAAPVEWVVVGIKPLESIKELNSLYELQRADLQTTVVPGTVVAAVAAAEGDSTVAVVAGRRPLVAVATVATAIAVVVAVAVAATC